MKAPIHKVLNKNMRNILNCFLVCISRRVASKKKEVVIPFTASVELHLDHVQFQGMSLLLVNIFVLQSKHKSTENKKLHFLDRCLLHGNI